MFVRPSSPPHPTPTLASCLPLARGRARGAVEEEKRRKVLTMRSMMGLFFPGTGRGRMHRLPSLRLTGDACVCLCVCVCVWSVVSMAAIFVMLEFIWGG